MGSAEIKNEIVLLREAECSSFEHMRPSRVRCGRHPFLSAADADARCRANLRRVSDCHEYPKFAHRRCAGEAAAGARGRRHSCVRQVDCNDKAVQARAALLYERAQSADLVLHGT